MNLRKRPGGALAALFLIALSLVPASAHAGGPPQAATAFSMAVIGPNGGSVSGFGMTATFAPGALTSPRLIILGNWPNGLDVAPPDGQIAVKTFGLQQCTPTGADCTSVFGNFPNSPAGSERIHGETILYTAFQPGVAYGSAANKLVTFTINTDGNRVYVYNANFQDTARAYPKLLPSTSDGTTLTFQTFQPIVWVVTAPSN